MKKSTIALLCSIGLCFCTSLMADTSPNTLNGKNYIQLADWWWYSRHERREEWCERHPKECHREWCDHHPNACKETWCIDHPRECREKWCATHPDECR